MWPEDGVKESIDAFNRAAELGAALGWSRAAYRQSVDLLKSMEDRLSTRKRVPLKRFILVPIALCLRGLQQMAVSYGRGYALAFALGLVGLFLSQRVGAQYRSAFEAATIGLNGFVYFTLIFAAPSTYCSSGINMKHVATVTDSLSAWRIASAIRIDLLMKNLKIFEERVQRRLLLFKWVLGGAWALYFSPLITEAVKKYHGSSLAVIDLLALFPPLAALAVVFLLVEAYGRGVDILFRSLELGCNESQARIDTIDAATPTPA